MTHDPPSSDELDGHGLSVLVACHHRGPLDLHELVKLIPGVGQGNLELLVRLGLLELERDAYQLTQVGRDRLMVVLDAIQQQLTPDAPEYVQRHRFEAPTLPVGADTVWAEAVCVNVRVKPAALRQLVPPAFELDLHRGEAFVSLTASRLKQFGVAGVPAPFRMNFYQATYRAHVRHQDFRGDIMRGCYFVRSETNSPVMSLAANLLPEFRAHHCSTSPILMARRGDHLLLSVDPEDPAGKVVLVLDTTAAADRLPATSSFASLADARAFIVDFHDAFSLETQTNEVFILRIERGEWNIRVVEVVDSYLGFFEQAPFSGDAVIDSVFYFRDCPYRWLPLLKEKRRSADQGETKLSLYPDSSDSVY